MMKNEEKLDAVLLYLNNEIEHQETIQLISKAGNFSFSNKELYLILEKLIKDGYVSNEYVLLKGQPTNKKTYYISFEGKIFLEKGGYKKENSTLQKIDQKFVVRHNILQTLQEKLSPFDGLENLNGIEIEMTLEELSKKAKLGHEDISNQIDYLSLQDEIHISWNEGIQSFLITQKGTIAYNDNKYIEEGNEKLWRDTIRKYNFDMATKKHDNSNASPDALIIEKEVFKEQLKNRVARTIDFLATLKNFNGSKYKQVNDAFESWDEFNIEYLKQSFNNEENLHKLTYEKLNSSSFISIYDEQTIEEKTDKLREDIQAKANFLKRLIDKADLLKLEPDLVKQKKPGVNSVNATRKVFIVHGHNHGVLHNVARTLTELQFQPIVLNEQPDQGKTIIEKIESFSDVGFAIVLLTADDEGKAIKESDYKKRARQNVIFEYGYLMSKLTRSRVLALYEHGVELPTDVHGILYHEIDAQDSWKYKIVKELKAAKYDVDANLLH